MMGFWFSNSNWVSFESIRAICPTPSNKNFGDEFPICLLFKGCSDEYMLGIIKGRVDEFLSAFKAWSDTTLSVYEKLENTASLTMAAASAARESLK
jgi:hypothetical protein